MDDVFTFRNRLIGEYSSFSRSFSKVAAPDILVKVEAEYARGRYWPEPLIQINPNYKRSSTAANASAGLMLFGEWCETRAKLVQPAFTQAIGEHWSRRRIEWNRLGRSHENLS